MALRFLTAGESHGPSLTAILEGLPANLELTAEDINRHLARRQEGYGRGGRMKIEKDQVSFLSGVRWGKTLGSPLTLSIENRDWANWEKVMSSHPDDRQQGVEVTRPRPGHADLSGAIKYRQSDVRNILERSSARETACRVAVGAVCQKFLFAFGVRVCGYVLAIGNEAAIVEEPEFASRFARSEKSPCRTYDPEAEQRMIAAIDRAREAGDSLGGIVEIVATGLPVGLGSHVHWDRKLDGRLAAAVMSIQAFKGVEIGLGFKAAGLPGSRVHDEICHGAQGFSRRSNHAGGLEGGMTNGQPLVVRGAMKPIPTLYQPLQSVDIQSKDVFEATVERSDVCAVPAAAVVAEAAVAIELADALLEKFGGDSMEEMIERVFAHREYARSF